MSDFGSVVVNLDLQVTCVCSLPADAQVLYGTLTGNVTDNTGAVIPNANIKALNSATGLSRETTTNAEGSYSFNDINPGTYQITIVAEGFTPQQQNGITVLTNTVDRVNVQLAVGSITQQVTVDTAPPLLQADRAETDYNISPEQIAELPKPVPSGAWLDAARRAEFRRLQSAARAGRECERRFELDQHDQN